MTNQETFWGFLICLFFVIFTGKSAGGISALEIRSALHSAAGLAEKIAALITAIFFTGNGGRRL